jgi:hypothetical protein
MRLSTFAARTRVERGPEYLRLAASCSVLAALGAVASTDPGTDSGQRAQCQKQQRPSLQRCGTWEVSPSTRVATWAVNPSTCFTTSGAQRRARAHTPRVRARTQKRVCAGGTDCVGHMNVCPPREQGRQSVTTVGDTQFTMSSSLRAYATNSHTSKKRSHADGGGDEAQLGGGRGGARLRLSALARLRLSALSWCGQTARLCTESVLVSRVESGRI